MRVKEKFQGKGKFWLPGKPLETVAGILTISDGGEIELETIGIFHSDADIINNKINIFDLHGRIEGGKSVTLSNCYYRNVQPSLFSELANSIVYCNLLYKGVALNNTNLAIHQNLEFSLDSVEEWFNIQRYKFNHSTRSIKYYKIKPIIIDLDTDITLSINFNLHYKGTRINGNIKSNISFELRSPKPQKLQDLLDYVYEIQTLFCFIICKTVVLESVTVDDINNKTGEYENSNSRIEVFYRSTPFVKNIKINETKILFLYSHIKKRFKTIVKSWIKIGKEYPQVLWLYFSASQNELNKSLEGKYLTLAQSLETFHRKSSDEQYMDPSEYKQLMKVFRSHCPPKYLDWFNGRFGFANEISLKQRFERLLEPFGHLFVDPKDISKLISKLTNTRNYYTHYNSKLEKQALRGLKLHHGNTVLETLTQLHILKKLGIKDEEIENIAKLKLDDKIKKASKII